MQSSPGRESHFAICNIVVRPSDAIAAKLGDTFQRLPKFCHLGGVGKVIADNDVAVFQVVDNPFVGQALRIEPTVSPARPVLTGCGRCAVVIHSHTFIDVVRSLDRNLNANLNRQDSYICGAGRANAGAVS